MKHLKLFENFNKSEIDDICKKYGIRNYIINPDGSIDVDGDINLVNINLIKLPLKFNIVSGEFDCRGNKLTSLEGCPKEVGGDFSCYANQLTSLEGCPKEVGGYFDCANNQLTSLIGCPKEVGGYFSCTTNQLTSLEGGPSKVGGSFYCQRNKLISLDGHPEEIGSSRWYYNNPISPIIDLFDDIKIYLEYQETYKFLRKDCKIVKHLLDDALKDYNEYYNKNVELPKKIKGFWLT